MPPEDTILKQIKAAQDKANKANLERYQELLGVIDTLRSEEHTSELQSR